MRLKSKNILFTFDKLISLYYTCISHFYKLPIIQQMLSKYKSIQTESLQVERVLKSDFFSRLLNSSR